MPLIKPEDKTPLIDLKCKIRADELEELKLYASAVNSSEDYVVGQAVRLLFADKDWKAWKEASGTGNAPAVVALVGQRKPRASKTPKTQKEVA